MLIVPSATPLGAPTPLSVMLAPKPPGEGPGLVPRDFHGADPRGRQAARSRQ